MISAESRTLTSRPDDDERPCLGAHEVFDAVLDHPKGGANRRAVAAARAICATCPLAIKARCLAANHDQPGVIAGKTLAERFPRTPPIERATCGKSSGWYAHNRANETPCDACRVAVNGDVRRRRIAEIQRRMELRSA